MGERFGLESKPKTDADEPWMGVWARFVIAIGEVPQEGHVHCGPFAGPLYEAETGIQSGVGGVHRVQTVGGAGDVLPVESFDLGRSGWRRAEISGRFGSRKSARTPHNSSRSRTQDRRHHRRTTETRSALWPFSAVSHTVPCMSVALRTRPPGPLPPKPPADTTRSRQRSVPPSSFDGSSAGRSHHATHYNVVHG